MEVAFDERPSVCSHRGLFEGGGEILALSAPESERSLRDAFRREINALGATPISTGLYLTPHDVTTLLPSSITPYLVTATATTLTVRGLSEPRAIVEALWPAQETLRRYDALNVILANDSSIGIDPLSRQLILADALEVALRHDPLIPIELRDAPWPPTSIRKKWMHQWEDVMSVAPDTSIYAGWLSGAGN